MARWCYKLMASFTYFISFFSMGIILSNIGPVMPSLMARTNTAITTMGFIVASRSLGYLIGCASAGVSYDKFESRGHWLLSMGLIGAGICNGIIPWVYSAIVLVVVFLIQGIFVGFLDTGCNVMLIRVHGENVDAWMQTLHMCFGVGALTSPVLVRAVEIYSSNNNFNWSFWIMAIFITVNGLLPLFLASPTAEHAKSAVEDRMSKFGTTILLLTGSVLFVYVGTEVNYGAYVLTYSLEQMHPSVTGEALKAAKASGQLLTTVYWASITGGRLIAIPVSAAGVSPLTCLLINQAGCIVTAVLMSVYCHSEKVLWACTVGFGLFMASTFPSMLNLTKTYIDITGKAASIFNVMACLGEVVLPIVVAFLFHHKGPVTFMYGNAVLAGVMLVIVLVTGFVGRRVLKSSNEGCDAGEAELAESIKATPTADGTASI